MKAEKNKLELKVTSLSSFSFFPALFFFCNQVSERSLLMYERGSKFLGGCNAYKSCVCVCVESRKHLFLSLSCHLFDIEEGRAKNGIGESGTLHYEE